MKKNIFLVFCLFLFLCCDGRPSIHEAKLFFEEKYPDVNLIDLSITEDEVAARSFEYKYKYNAEIIRKIEIQFMEIGNSSKWAPSPEAPNVLPR